MNREKIAGLSTPKLLEKAVRRVRKKKDVEDEERWFFVHELRQRADTEVLEGATLWCQSANAAERELGVDVLAQLGHVERAGTNGNPPAASEAPFAAKRLEVLTGRLTDTSNSVLSAVLVGLGHMASWDVEWPTSLVEAFAEHPHTDVRFGLVQALSGGDRCQGCSRATELLIGLMSDDDMEIRNWATFGLGVSSDVDGELVRAALRTRLADEDEDDEIRGEALVGLAKRRDDSALPALLEVLAGDLVTTLTIDAAEALGAPELVEPLTRLVSLWPAEADRIQEAIEACGGRSPEREPGEAG